MVTMIKVNLKKWGNSFGVIIPKDVVENRKLNENDQIEILIMEKDNVLKETFGILKGKIKKTSQQIKDEIREDEAAAWERKFGKY